MKHRKFIISISVTCAMVLFIMGCAHYKTVTFQTHDDTSLQGTSIVNILQTLGEPTTMTYYNDGTSQVEWENISMSAEDTHIFTKKIQQAKSGTLMCNISISVNNLGKINTHNLTCYQKEKVDKKKSK